MGTSLRRDWRLPCAGSWGRVQPASAERRPAASLWSGSCPEAQTQSKREGVGESESSCRGGAWKPKADQAASARPLARPHLPRPLIFPSSSQKSEVGHESSDPTRRASWKVTLEKL